jgi:putative ABC transport system permease protein
MIKNFFLLAFRNYLKNKAYAIINILGLGAAMACCIVAFLNYRFEADYNKTHVNRDKIYKINVSRKLKDRIQVYGMSPTSLAPALANDIAGIDKVCRYDRNDLSVRYEAKGLEPKIFVIDLAFADKDFLSIFTFPLKWGDETSFLDQGKILLSEETSEKFFGDTNPVGESVTCYTPDGKGVTLIVGGVFKKIPYNSVVRFDGLTLFPNYISFNKVNEFNWKDWVAGTFLQISNPENVKGIEKSLSNYIDIHNKNELSWQIEQYSIQSLMVFTKDSKNIWSNGIGFDMHPAQIITPTVMAVLILLLACFNFVNTSIASSNKRLKEIGIRKVVGSQKGSLVFQFIGENFIICFLALLVSLLIGIFLISEYDKMWPFEIIRKDFLAYPGILIFLISTLFGTALIAAVYPAFYISSFNPIQVLKGSVKFSGTGAFSRVLLILQFSISLISLISSIVFTQNAAFQEKFFFGYNKDQLLTIPTGSYENLDKMQQSLQNHPDVQMIAPSSFHIPWNAATRTAFYSDKKAEIRLFNTYSGYLDVMGLKVDKGRSFTPDFEVSDINHSALVNESMVKEFGWDDPIGKVIKIDTLNLVVVGVLKDYYTNLWSDIYPTVMRTIPKNKLGLLVVKANKDKLVSLNAFAKKEWEKVIPNSPYEGNILDPALAEAQDINSSIQKMFNFLSFVAIFLSIIALYTLISLNIIKRTKEIGIRKALGAPSMHVNNMIGKPFYFMLLISSVIGGVSGYYLTNILLGSIWKQHIAINVLSIAIPIIIMLVLSYIVLSSKVFQTLRRNPINSLRYE